MKLTERIMKIIQPKGNDKSGQVEKTGIADVSGKIKDEVTVSGGQGEGGLGKKLGDTAFKGTVTGGMIGLIKRADVTDEKVDNLKKEFKDFRKTKKKVELTPEEKVVKLQNDLQKTQGKLKKLEDEKKYNRMPLGKKMFLGAGTVGSIGVISGIVLGWTEAQQKIESLPIQTVQLPSYKVPVYGSETAGVSKVEIVQRGGRLSPLTHTYSSAGYTYPVENSDGSLYMEQMPPKNISGHGTPIFSEKIHDIKGPIIYNQTNRCDGKVNTRTKVDYETIGSWSEPTVKFENGVNVGGQIALYSLGGLALGIVGGALAALAMDKAGVI